MEQALSVAGVTPERVEQWLGQPCGGCKERKEKLNQLELWVRRVLHGKVENAKQFLERMMRF